MKHVHADILQAIAEDKDTEIEWLNQDDRWSSTSGYQVLMTPHDKFRIKPKTIKVNGVDCPKPVGGPLHSYPYLEIVTHISGSRVGGRYCYNFVTDDDLLKVFDAIVLPFEESWK